MTGITWHNLESRLTKSLFSSRKKNKVKLMSEFTISQLPSIATTKASGAVVTPVGVAELFSAQLFAGFCTRHSIFNRITSSVKLNSGTVH